jgi:Secretion system C-terminal sorting domain
MNLRRVFLMTFVFMAFDATTFAQGFTVGDNPAPTLTSVNPSVVVRSQTLNVVLRGTNFISATVPSFGSGGDVTVNSITVDSTRQLTVNITVSPTATLGSRDVTVTNPAPGGGVSVLTNGFVVGDNPNLVPTLASIAPTSAVRLETLNMVFRGSGFVSGVTTVVLGPDINVNEIKVVSFTELTANISVTGKAALGSRTVHVINAPPGGGITVLVGFSVNLAPPPPPTLSVDGQPEIPRTSSLFQNYPNPFNPSTTIRYGLPNRSHVTLSVFNTLGQQVAQLVNGDLESGYHDVQFDGSGLSSGVYLYRVQVRPLDSAIGRDSKSGAGDFVQTRSLLLLR